MKPPGSTWTDEQWQAITAGGSDILVAAAAGSGKTAVLVERIIRKISGSTDVDRLLVATFTKAAAAEMKERIRLALERALEQDPASEHLRRQLALINRAAITTLHSFCMDVIRRYYPLIGLDPGFRIANTTEAELLRMEVLDRLLEQRYTEAASQEDHPFIRLVDDYGGERGDEPLYRLVLQLYDFSRSHPWPDQWLESAAELFKPHEEDELAKTRWMDGLTRELRLALEGACAMARQAIGIAKLPGGPAGYTAQLEEDLALLETLLQGVRELPWQQWQASFQSAQLGRLKPLKKGSYDEQLQETVKELREQMKELLAQTKGELAARRPEEFAAELAALGPQMKELSRLVIDFAAAYEEAKRKRSLLDFGDLEHYCLRILRDPSSTEKQVLPSAAALEYQQQFDEILLDEYQDTNMVQEAIVSLLSRRSPGNRFMVGDVKQSIYRFRLAEPNLFLHKYKSFAEEGGGGLRIDLARNFRSRQEVVDGVNDVFRAIMREKVAEMDYDRSAELVCGASYPPPAQSGSRSPYAVELTLLDRSGLPEAAGEQSELEEGEEVAAAAMEAAELATAQLEARWIALQIRRLMEGDNESGTAAFAAYDGKQKASRSLMWRDIVVLLRATSQWAPILIEELQAAGIPAYAELSSGYFEATEVETMLSLLRIIDNPYQDIPLAGVLRSPLYGLTAEELAIIRMSAARGAYYDAVKAAVVTADVPVSLCERLERFLVQLGRWREEARQGSLADLIWLIYTETGYYDLVGGLPGGVQRQANLRALHDRARQYEETSFRGLFRFLRFVDRMRESGGDLGTARALGEQEDVVRIMSIHKSKGLEFPVVFVAGLGKMFNMQDLNLPFLMHKELGYGPKVIDRERRVGYPSLPYLAIRRQMRMEMLAEEMRVLYVALTRPKEKLFLIGTSKDAQKQLERAQELARDSSLPDYALASARRYLDWLLPLAMQGGAGGERLEAGSAEAPGLQGWRFALTPAALLGAEAAVAAEGPWEDEQRQSRREQLAMLRPVELDVPERSVAVARAIESLSWRYSHPEAAALAAKTSVTEMKRLYSTLDQQNAADLAWVHSDAVRGGQAGAGGNMTSSGFALRRPRFMEERAMSAAELGTLNHLVMQHVPLAKEMGAGELEEALDVLQRRQLITARQREAVNTSAILQFFASPLAARLRSAKWVRREVPFSYRLPAERLYGTNSEGQLEREAVLIQGVIDCLFREEQGLVLLDYKSDRILDGRYEQTAERHRFQLELYAEAASAILGEPIAECFIFFFDGAQAVRINLNYGE